MGKITLATKSVREVFLKIPFNLAIFKRSWLYLFNKTHLDPFPQMRPFGGVAPSNFAIYGWKSAGCVVLIFSFISCWKFPKANCFRVYGQLTTWPTIAKGLLTMDYLFRKRTVSEKSKSIFHKLIFNLVGLSSAHQKLLPIHESVYSLKSIVRVP